MRRIALRRFGQLAPETPCLVALAGLSPFHLALLARSCELHTTFRVLALADPDRGCGRRRLPPLLASVGQRASAGPGVQAGRGQRRRERGTQRRRTRQQDQNLLFLSTAMAADLGRHHLLHPGVLGGLGAGRRRVFYIIAAVADGCQLTSGYGVGDRRRTFPGVVLFWPSRPTASFYRRALVVGEGVGEGRGLGVGVGVTVSVSVIVGVGWGVGGGGPGSKSRPVPGWPPR